MSLLSFRPGDDRGGLRPTEKWSSSGRGRWGNYYHQQQVVNVVEPASMSPGVLYASGHTQSMFPQPVWSREQDSALVQAITDCRNAGNDVNGGLEYALLQSSNSNSMVESSTSEEDCTAPENVHMNCISALGGGPVSPDVLDRTGSTGATSLMAQEDFLRMRHPGGGPSVDSLRGADVMAGLERRRFEAGDEVQRSGWKTQSGQQGMPLPGVGSGGYADQAPQSSYSARDAMSPISQKSNAGAGADMDSMRAILFLHASQPVPSLEEIARSRPKRRNVRISKDPQSVAARHRRERISDRMRVLQRLVPGGTKMDTASMLDEAIHYVKFLKLQLQTLEQIGNNSCDKQGSLAQRQAGVGEAHGLGSSLDRRPFDLNCAAAYQAWPLNTNSSSSNNNNNVNNNSLQAAPPQGRHSNQWA